MRRKLIYIIENYYFEELTINEWVTLAQASDEELLDVVHTILEHYFNENQVI
jgi:hypothetical protein